MRVGRPSVCGGFITKRTLCLDYLCLRGDQPNLRNTLILTTPCVQGWAEPLAFTPIPNAALPPAHDTPQHGLHAGVPAAPGVPAPVHVEHAGGGAVPGGAGGGLSPASRACGGGLSPVDTCEARGVWLWCSKRGFHSDSGRSSRRDRGRRCSGGGASGGGGWSGEQRQRRRGAKRRGGGGRGFTWIGGGAGNGS